VSKTVGKAMRVIETLAESSNALSVADVSRSLNTNKPTVHRLLRSLVQLGYVRQRNETTDYEPTTKLWELGMKVIARRTVGQIAGSVMRDLSRQTGETVHLAIPDNDDAVYIDKVDGTHPLRIFTPVGGRVPLYCGSTGKAILAFMDAGQIERVGRNLKPFTPRTITSISDLQRELAMVRQRGYAINIGEWRAGISGVAAPIRDRTGAVIASVCISGPSDRLTSAVLRATGPLVGHAAAEISAELGFIDPVTAPVSQANASLTGTVRKKKHSARATVTA
jgi:IclR family transcriptional regulator, KDG regulon repressor